MLPHRRKRTACIIALALAVSSAAAPVSARVFNKDAHGSLVFPQQTVSASSARSNLGHQALPGPAPTIVRVTVPTGFDWGDAGIGAAGGSRAPRCSASAPRSPSHNDTPTTRNDRPTTPD